MKFTVPDLRSMVREMRSLSADDDTQLSDLLHRRQTNFSDMIDEVGTDPRCIQAYWFCTVFCALALMHAEERTGVRLPAFPGFTIGEMAGLVARGEESQIGRRTCGYRERIRKHVLKNSDFDQDDTEWLCTTLSAFLLVIEMYVSARYSVGARPEPREMPHATILRHG